MRVLAEIPARSSPDLRAGTLRRRDLEAYTGLLAELGAVRGVLVTGREGRQATAVDLASAAAAGGRRTVLLEGELRQPALAGALGLAAAPGLSEYLCGEADPGAILQPLVLAGPGSGRAVDPLVCIVAGAGPATLDPFASERFRRAVEGLRSAYELVVIEGPSLEDERALIPAADLADATVARCTKGEVPRRLRRHVDGVLATAA